MEMSNDVTVSDPVVGKATAREWTGSGYTRWRIVSRAEDGAIECATLCVKGLTVTLSRRLGLYLPTIWFLDAPPIYKEQRMLQASSFEEITNGVEALLAKHLRDEHQALQNMPYAEVVRMFVLSVRNFDSYFPHLWAVQAPYYLPQHVLTAKTSAEAETEAVAALRDELLVLSTLLGSGQEQCSLDVHDPHVLAINGTELQGISDFVNRCSRMRWRLVWPRRVSELEHHPISSATLPMEWYAETLRIKVDRTDRFGNSDLWRVTLPFWNHGKRKYHSFDVRAVDFESAVRLAGAQLQKDVSEIIAQGEVNRWGVLFSCKATDVPGRWKISSHPFLWGTLVFAKSGTGYR